MNTDVPLEPAAPEPGPARPAVTFMGNTYDLVSLGALGSALLTAFLCLTLSYGIYFLPILPLVLGLIGLLAANRAVDEQRTRTFSWISLVLGAGILLLIVLCLIGSIVLYALFFALLLSTEGMTGKPVSLL